MTGSVKDELEIVRCGPNYGMQKLQAVTETGTDKKPKTAVGELSEIVDIGRKLSNYGTYLCNRRHNCPSRHICSFLICPGRQSADPYPVRPAVSLAPSDSQELSITSCLGTRGSRQARKKRSRVRFSDCLDSFDSNSHPVGGFYPLDDDLTAKLSAIRLTRNPTYNRDNIDSIKGFETSAQSDKAVDMFGGLSDGVSRMDIQDTF
eukprot:GFUD01010460.1.p1 GENE.GFUD01010460.1~~GFUD01010460.1.p1  ORF type:complete len:205 (+),score=56.59 GFUD01010460.1:118-732(+)